MITNIQVQLKQSDYKRWMQKNSYISLQTCWMPIVICMANCWLEDQDQILFYSGVRALEKCWT